MNTTTPTKLENLKPYLFTSSLAVNLFMEIIIIANWLSIQFFYYAIPMTIRIDLLPPLENTLLWVASLCIAYITKETIQETRSFQLINRLLNTALIGSLLILLSASLTLIGSTAEPTLKQTLNQLWLLTASIGYPLSFAASSIALITITTQNKRALTLFLIYLLSLLIPIEIWALAHWVAYPFNITSYLGFAWQGAFMELQLFYLTYPLILWLFTAFLFSWIWIPLIKFAKDKISQKKRIHVKGLFVAEHDANPQNEATPEKSPDHKDPNSQKPSTRFPLAVLLISLIIGVFTAYYPYINPQPGLAGWDTLGYYLSLTGMANKNLYGAIQYAATTDRPLFFLILYLAKALTQLPAETIIELMPIITISANALAIFWFVRTGEKKPLAASIAAIFSVFSFNTIIAMHAGTLANWLAMAFGFTMFGLILKLQEKMSLKLLLAAILASASAFLIHYWSGAFFMMILGFYVFLMLLQRLPRITKFAAVLSVAIVLIAVFSVGLASRFFISYGSTEDTGLTEVFAAFWTKLPVFIDSWFFGALANPVMMALALIGIAACFYKRTRFSRILISWTVVGSLLSVLIAPIGRNTNQWLMWRAVYLIPFQIPAALGLFYLMGKLRPFGQNPRSVERKNEDVRQVKSLSLPRNEKFRGFFYVVIEYGATALLLTLGFPVLGALILFNYLILTLIVHFRVQKMDSGSVLVFMFAVFVILLLFNYALRTLSPLTVIRMQP